MAAVTQVVPHFLGGVSKQTDQKKVPGQVRDCLNAYPDPTFGLMKRPGFKFIKTIYSGSSPELTDGKWFFIKRDNEEIYIGCILKTTAPHADEPIRIWNKLGEPCTIYYDAVPWATGTAYKVGNRVTSDTDDKLYQCVTEGTSAASPTGTGANISDGPDLKWDYVSGPAAKAYLDATHDDYHVLTVQDTSIITNKNKKCAPLDPEDDHVSGSFGTVRLLNVAYSNRYMIKVKIPSVSNNFYGTDYSDSIKYVGNSTDLVDSERTEGSYLGITPTTQKRGDPEATFTADEQATFNVTVNAVGGTIVSLANRGRGYQKGDKFTFNDAILGGKSAIKSIGLTTGKTGSGRTTGTYTVTGLSGGSSGTEAEVTVYIADDSDDTATVTLTEGGKGWSKNDTISIASSNFGGGTDITLTVTDIKSAKDVNTEILELNDDQTDNIAAQYYTINAEDNTTANQVSTPADEKYLTANRILTQLSDGLDNNDLPAGYEWEKKKLDSTLELRIKNTGPDPDVYVPFELTTSDNQGNFSIESFNEDVNSVADLPAQTTHGRVVRVVNSGPADTTYWSKFTAENEDKGKGFWEESIDPTVSKGLDKSTMPHQLFNVITDVFVFRQADWTDRTVGDNTTNAHPGFIYKDSNDVYARTIQQCFYHNNRLGMLTDDNVVMSKTSDFFNFYYTSALTITDNDPIDINCSSLRPAVLHGVLPTAQGLILFSRNQQFIMFSDAEVLTPASAIIRGISNYEMDPRIDPVESGTLLNFVSKTPSSTRVFSVQTRGAEESPDVLDVGKIVSGWIPQTTKNLISSPQNSLIALYGDNSITGTIGSPTIYIYKTYIVGERIVMQAWVKWDLPGNIQHVSIDADVMYAVVENSGKYILCSTNLTEAPEETILTTADGQRVNPYMDLYSKAQNGTDPSAGGYKTVVYDAAEDYSKCYIPYTDLADLNPVILIAGNATDNFAGVTESGFTINPTRVEDGSDVYFKVPGKDLTSQAANVYVGYQYNYDVELPKTYFKLNPEGTQYDYTAALTVARMKFALGLSSVCSFKVTSKGYRGEIAEFTGDGSISTFTVPFVLKEENGIKVTLDGAEQASDTYKVTSTDTTSTVDFTHKITNVTTPPERYTVSRLYGGSGYTATDGTANGTKTSVATTVTPSSAGSGLTVNITISSGIITDVRLNNDGSGYVEGEVVSIDGGTPGNGGFIVGPAQKIAITTDTWYDVHPSSDAGQYLADDVPLVEENVFTIPIHQRSENFNMRVFSNSPFPVSLTSMMWEGQYSPRFYRRT